MPIISGANPSLKLSQYKNFKIKYKIATIKLIIEKMKPTTIDNLHGILE